MTNSVGSATVEATCLFRHFVAVLSPQRRRFYSCDGGQTKLREDVFDYGFSDVALRKVLLEVVCPFDTGTPKICE